MQRTPLLISSIVKRIPAVLPYLNDAAGYSYCEYKLIARDPQEPGIVEKERTERKLKAAILSRFKHQFELLQNSLNANYGKTISAPGVFIPDDPEETQALVKIVIDGILSGAIIAADGVGFPLADGSVNSGALAYAQTYVTQWLRGLDEKSQKDVREALTYFTSTPGATVGDAIVLLEKSFGTDRAWRIAITETTRIYAEANQIFANQLALQYPGYQVIKRYYTNNDDRVCPICSPLDGKEAAYNDEFAIPNPPLHVNCRCWTAVTVKA